MNLIEIQDIKNISNIEELKKIGSIDEIINVINNDIKPLKLEKCNKYEELFNNIKKLKEKWLDWVDIPFFKSKRDEYIFKLTKMSGKARMIALNADNDALYENKKEAKKWRDNIAKYVHSDKKGSDEAFRELQEIYQTMIDHKD